ncbi:DUF3438 family protein [Vibrio rotiferianus]|uniref:DUF3438 family protein n=1 Tax=Vibrio rotiferianus TaxID=190895 RepID=UPI0005EED1D2|nr:DUF3438 family protein [Vibrio rotiferianus]
MRNFIIALIVWFCVEPALANERVKWEQGKEINLELVIGDERKVVFPEVVMFWNEPEYMQLFAHSFIDQSFYITAKASFNKRLSFRGVNSNRIYIINALSGESGQMKKAAMDLIIHLNAIEQEVQPETVSDSTSPPWKKRKTITAVDLVQFASQSLYSQVIEPVEGVTRTSIISSPVKGMYRMGALEGVPLASWHGGGLYVTAVKMKNTTSQVIHYDPCRVRGDFLFSAAQFERVYPKHSKKSYTVIYLVSQVPFFKAIASRSLKCQPKSLPIH